MNDEIIDVCKEINKIPKCTCCGGEYIQDTCSSCGTKNTALTELISKLNSLIIEFRNQVDLKNITEVNELFNNLYNLNRYQIPSVNQILIDTNYHEILKEHSKCLIGKITNDEKLNQDDYSFLSFLLINNHLNDKIKLGIIDVLYKAIYNKEYNVDLQTAEKTVKIFMEKSIETMFGIKSKHCYISEDKEKENYGSSFYGNIAIDRNVVREFINGNSMNLFETYFHEITHVNQFVRSKNAYVSAKDMTILKDFILGKSDRKYYHDNYVFLSGENQAFLDSSILALKYMKKLGISPTEADLEKIETNREFHEQFLGLTTRMYKDEVHDLNDLFDNYVFDNPKTLDEYPQLRLEYTVEENGVRRKKREEIEAEYKAYMEGSLKVNGDKEDIKKYFDNLLEKTKSETNDLKNNVK